MSSEHPVLRFRFDPPLDGEENMRIDWELLRQVEEGSEDLTFVRFYRWAAPTVSVGKHQIASDAIDEAFCRSNQIPVVQRPTGGRAVFHDCEVTYAVISSRIDGRPGGIERTYRDIAGILRNGLLTLGIDCRLAARERAARRASQMRRTPCFITPSRYELISSGKKIVGSAQRRLKHSYLQHGSIPLRIDYLKMGSALACEPERLMATMISVSEAAGRTVEYEELTYALHQAFAGWRRTSGR